MRVGVVNVADDRHLRLAREQYEFGESAGVAFREEDFGVFVPRRDEERVVEECDGHALAVRAPVLMIFKKLADRARLKLEAAEADDLFGALVGAPASEQLVGRDDLEVYVLEVAAFRRVRVLERRDLHGGDWHARLAARQDLAAVPRQRHATAQHAERPAARLLVRAPALAEADDRAARALQLVRRVSDARR